MSGGGKYTWEAHNKKIGMSGEELEAALLNAKAMFGSMTPLTVRVNIGWKHQLEAITFEEEAKPKPIKDTRVRVQPLPRTA